MGVAKFVYDETFRQNILNMLASAKVRTGEALSQPRGVEYMRPWASGAPLEMMTESDIRLLAGDDVEVNERFQLYSWWGLRTTDLHLGMRGTVQHDVQAGAGLATIKFRDLESNVDVPKM